MDIMKAPKRPPGGVGVEGESILVIGGGLSAMQAAISFARRGIRVILASRRPHFWRHFDLPISWFDRRTRSSHGFFSTNMEERPAFIKDARGGGTVPVRMHTHETARWLTL